MGRVTYARTDDGIVHIIELEETRSDWGRLICGFDFGLGHSNRTEEGFVWVDLVTSSPTCIECVASEKSP
jgi:hypothetical protein